MVKIPCSHLKLDEVGHVRSCVNSVNSLHEPAKFSKQLLKSEKRAKFILNRNFLLVVKETNCS